MNNKKANYITTKYIHQECFNTNYLCHQFLLFSSNVSTSKTSMYSLVFILFRKENYLICKSLIVLTSMLCQGKLWISVALLNIIFVRNKEIIDIKTKFLQKHKRSLISYHFFKLQLCMNWIKCLKNYQFLFTILVFEMFRFLYLSFSVLCFYWIHR